MFHEKIVIGLESLWSELWRSLQPRMNQRTHKLRFKGDPVERQQWHSLHDGCSQGGYARCQADIVVRWAAAFLWKSSPRVYLMWGWVLDNALRSREYQKIKEHFGLQKPLSWATAPVQPLSHEGLECYSQWCDATEKIVVTTNRCRAEKRFASGLSGGTRPFAFSDTFALVAEPTEREGMTGIKTFGDEQKKRAEIKLWKLVMHSWWRHPKAGSQLVIYGLQTVSRKRGLWRTPQQPIHSSPIFFDRWSCRLTVHEM